MKVLQDACRESSFGEDLGDLLDYRRGLRGRLEDYGVTGKQRWNERVDQN